MTFAGRVADSLGAWQARLYMRLRPGIRRLEQRIAERSGERPPSPHLVTGIDGERLAYLHLVRLGYTVIARRWSSERISGDLDLVAYDGPTLVIFEVKTRTARDEYAAEERVDPGKQGRLRRLAVQLLREIRTHALEPPPIRFDILAVYLIGSGVEIEHYPNAFPLAPRTAARRSPGIQPYAGSW